MRLFQCQLTANSLPPEQVEKADLQREVRWHEEQRMREWERAEAGHLSGRHAGEDRLAAWPEAGAAEDTGAALTRETAVQRSGQKLSDGEEGSAVDGTDSDAADDAEQEVASYAAIHGLSAQPGSTAVARPSRQQRLWEEGRNNAATWSRAAQPHSPSHHFGAVDELVRDSGGGLGGAIRAARASVSWDLPADAAGGAAETSAADLGTHGRREWPVCRGHDVQTTHNAWALAAETGAVSEEGRYAQTQHRHDAGGRWRPHEDPEPTRSISPCRAASHRAAASERAVGGESSSLHGGGLQHSGDLRHGVSESQQRSGKAAAVGHGLADGAPRHRNDCDSRKFWHRFAAGDDVEGDVRGRSSIGAAGHGREEHGKVSSTAPEASNSALIHASAAGTGARWMDTRASSSIAARKVRYCAASCKVTSELAMFCRSETYRFPQRWLPAFMGQVYACRLTPELRYTHGETR